MAVPEIKTLADMKAAMARKQVVPQEPEAAPVQKDKDDVPEDWKEARRAAAEAWFVAQREETLRLVHLIRRCLKTGSGGFERYACVQGS